MKAGDVEYNWLDCYNIPTVSAGENIEGGFFACGEYTKSRSELTSDNVDTTRSVYSSGGFPNLFDISSTPSFVYSRKWHEDCVLSILNPAINQAVQICKAEGELERLRENKCVDPEMFTE